MLFAPRKAKVSFWGPRRNEQSLNKCNYLETLNLLVVEEYIMKEYIETNIVFSGRFSEIQIDIIESVSIAINEKFCDGINKADFVSIQANGLYLPVIETVRITFYLLF